MTTMLQNAPPQISRNMSYNDLKKRRMSRSMTNKGKLQAIHNTNQIKKTQNQLLISADTNQKNRKLQSIQVYLNNCHANKENQFSRQVNSYQTTESFASSSSGLKMHNFEKCSSNARLLPKLETVEVHHHGMKKTKSTRILTKKTVTSCMLGKPNGELLKPIDQIDTCFKQKYAQNVHLEKYKSAPENNLMKSMKSSSSVFLEALSPIQAKKDKELPRQGEVSGLSLIFQMQQENQNQNRMNLKKTKEKTAVSSFQIEVFHEIEPKMPKIMRKHLPKDFFLRV